MFRSAPRNQFIRRAMRRNALQQLLSNDELEDSVAEKLQALIIEMIPLRFMAQARMCQCFRQQKRIAEFVTDAFFERCHITVVLSEVEEYYSSLTENKTRERQVK